MHDTPARRDDHLSITGSSKFPLFFCATRWIEGKVVADRLLDIWENIVKLVRYYEKLPKSKQPSSKSFVNVQKACNDIFSIEKFQFFSFIAGYFQPFLTAYPTDAPMLPFLYGDLNELVLQLLTLIVKPCVLDSCKNVFDVDLKNKDNLLPFKSVGIGFAAEVTLSNLLKNDQVKLSDVKDFKGQCMTFLTCTISKMLERSPLSNSLVKTVSCLRPDKLLVASNNQSQMKRLLHSPVNMHIVTATKSDTAHNQYATFLRNDAKINQVLCEESVKGKDRLDVFYLKKMNKSKFKEMAFVFKIIFTLSYGQSVVERL